MTGSSATMVLRAEALNGERPGWDARRQKRFWVDIRKSALHLFGPATLEGRSWELPTWIACLSRGPHLETLFVTSASWPKPPEWRADHPDEGGLFSLEAPVPGLPPNRFDPGAFQ